MWHIAKRELYDNLNSLRFALATVLLLGLMLTNAAVYLHEHPRQIQKYNAAVHRICERFDSSSRQFIYTRARRTGIALQKNRPRSVSVQKAAKLFYPNVVGGAFLWSISGGL